MFLQALRVERIVFPSKTLSRFVSTQDNKDSLPVSTVVAKVAGLLVDFHETRLAKLALP